MESYFPPRTRRTQRIRQNLLICLISVQSRSLVVFCRASSCLRGLCALCGEIFFYHRGHRGRSVNSRFTTEDTERNDPQNAQIRHSCFVIRSSFVIRISSFPKHRAIRVIRGSQTLPPACPFACHACLLANAFGVASGGGESVSPKKS